MTVYEREDLHSLAPLAIGAVLMVMIFAGGHISGAHYNPAVTLAVLVRGKIALNDAIAYWIVQFVAAVAAAALVTFLRDHRATPAPDPDVAKAIIVEFLFTFALCYVVLNVATAKGTANNSFYGLAIGFTVLAGALAVGPISGGAFNPAVAVGITMLNIVKLQFIWIYFVANFAAAIAAAFVFQFLKPGDK
jgi:aquaporin Z